MPPRNLFHTKVAVPGKLQLFQPSTLRRRHSWSILPFANMETVERMVLSQWSLLDTCTSALSSVLLIDMNWIAARTPHQLARLARHWTSTSAYLFPAWQILFNACSCWEPEQATWLLINTGFLEALTQEHQQPRNLLHTKVEVPGKLQLFQPSTLRRGHSWSIWPFDEDRNWEENVSLTVVTGWHMHWCPFFSTGDRHELDCCTNAPSIGKTGKILN